MRKYRLFESAIACVLCFFVITLVGCKNDIVVDPTAFTQFELGLIPFSSRADLTYVDSSDMEYAASVTKRKLDTLHGLYSSGQYISSEMRLRDLEINMEISRSLARAHGAKASFYVSISQRLGTGIVPTTTTSNITPDPASLTDIQINDEWYNNVFVMNASRSHTNQTFTFKRIIYSPERGVELIELPDGNFYKLVD